MGLLTTLGKDQGYLKAGFQGFAGSGKTFTATQLAIGTRAFFKLEGPIAIMDTEGGSPFVHKMILEGTGKPGLVLRSRALSDGIAFLKECLETKVSVAIVDSITHLWEEVQNSYLKQVNEKRVAAGQHPRQMQIQDWMYVKRQFNVFMTSFLNDPMHVIICGRARIDTDTVKDDEGNKEIIKTGVSMKSEKDTAFEPSLMAEMERIRTMVGSRPQGAFAHQVTILKDRFNVIDGLIASNPTFDTFSPHLQLLAPGANTPINVTKETQHNIDEKGDAEWQRERKQRAILSEEIKELLNSVYPGQGAEEKKMKNDLVETYFGTRSWTKISEDTKSERLRVGLAKLKDALITSGTIKDQDLENAKTVLDARD